MDLKVIEPVDRERALALFRAYRAAHRIRPNDYDLALMRVYRAMAKGLRVLDIVEVMRAAGVDGEGRPRLAIVRANATHVHFRVVNQGGGLFCSFPVRGKQRPRSVVKGDLIGITDNTFDGLHAWSFHTNPRAVVPTIPPEHRPKQELASYHILFEPAWEDVPADPFLLKHLYGPLFVIIAQWDLSEVEQMVLRMIERQGGTR
jgi:hypothetical protein